MAIGPKSKTLILNLILIPILVFLPGGGNATGVSVLRDPRQFRFGFEPTKTNFPMLLEQLGAVVKKAAFGKGKGVLSDNLKYSVQVLNQYMKLVEQECPECKVRKFRDSHGETAFRIEYPGGYYIQPSLDSAAIEWQTRPSTIPEIQEQLSLIQREIFDRSKKMHTSLNVNALGGHVTFSGFGNDTFWFGNYLKFRAKNELKE